MRRRIRYEYDVLLLRRLTTNTGRCMYFADVDAPVAFVSVKPAVDVGVNRVMRDPLRGKLETSATDEKPVPVPTTA